MAGGFPSPLSVWDQCRVPQPCWRRAEMALGTRCAGSWAWCRGAFLALTLRLGASALPLLLAEVCSEPASSAAPRDSVRGPVQCWGLLEHPSCCDHLFPTFSSFGQEIFAGASPSSVASRGAAWATGPSPFPSRAWSCSLQPLWSLREGRLQLSEVLSAWPRGAAAGSPAFVGAQLTAA